MAAAAAMQCSMQSSSSASLPSSSSCYSRALNQQQQQQQRRFSVCSSSRKSSSRSMRVQSKLLAPPPPSPSPSPSSPVLEFFKQQLDRHFQEQLQQQQVEEIVQQQQQQQKQQQRRRSWDAIPLWESMAARDAAARSAAQSSWTPLQRATAAALDKIEESLIPLLERGKGHLPSTSNPAIQLAGNFAPVAENPPSSPLEIQGELPSCLRGAAYVRNGANPRFRPSAGHHLFDGDGMLHSVSFDASGGASYTARFTRTARLAEEERLGRPIFPKAVGELHGHGGAARLLLFYARAAAGIVDASQGMGPANAGVVFFDGKLLAMSEDDKPYALRLDPESGDLQTLGRFDFDGQLECGSMIAHPKIDASTGEMFALSYDVIRRPHLRYFSFDAEGNKRPDVEISVDGPTMMHDFAITENYVVIPDQQVVFRLANMLQGNSPVVYDKNKVSRFGVLPRLAVDESQMRWVEVPDCFCFHVWNAWEEVDRESGHDVVVVLGSCMTPADCIFNEEHGSEEMSSVLCEIRLDLTTGASTRRPLASGINLEAGMVNKNLLGRKTRYLYLAIADPWPMVSGVAKVDTFGGSAHGSSSCVVGKNVYGENCFGGEPMFVPRSDDPNAAEDDGYVLVFVHNESTDQSELRVLDASTDDLQLVATVKLPSRVPYGFHGTFLTAKDIASQH